MAAKHGPTVVRDPEEHIGDHLKILQQTTGGWFVYDDRRAPADRAVPGPDGKIRTWKTMADSIAAATKMVEAEALAEDPDALTTHAWTKKETWEPRTK